MTGNVICMGERRDIFRIFGRKTSREETIWETKAMNWMLDK
jgi:hypothetical protein